MTFLPIVERELREASRRRSTFWIRLQAAAIALVIGIFFFLSEMERSPTLLGKSLFISLAAFVLLQALVAGAWRTADCISEEKREGTLGLLFLTDLKGYDIVFGKLAATSLNVLYGLLAVIPVMAIPLLLGGVTLKEFIQVTLAAFNNLFFSLAVGMFCSAVSRDERKALSAAFLTLIVLTVVLPMVVGLVISARNISPPPWWWMTPSPAFTSFMAFDPGLGTAGSTDWFYVSLAVVHGLGWLLLVAACWIVPRTWHESGRRETSVRSSPARKTRAAFRAGWLDINPFTWLALRGPYKSRLVWFFLGVSAVLWIWGWIKNPRDWLDSPTYILTCVALHSILKIWLVSEACRRFALDRRSGALELILSTPLQVKEILRGQIGALWNQFAGPVAVILLVDLIFLLQCTGTLHGAMGVFLQGGDRRETAFALGAGMISLVADLVTLTWVGMWMGLRAKSVNRAAWSACARVLVLPWGIFIATLIIFSILGASTRSGEGTERILYWLLLSLGADLFFGLKARYGLIRHFRETATIH